MSQNGKIGCGWYEDIVGDETDEFHSLAADIMRDKLTEVFNLIQERHNEKRKKDEDGRKNG